MDIVGSKHIVGHIALVEINMCPLSALRLMARYGIGELHLQGIIVFVGAHMLHAVCFQGDVGIVGKDTVEKLFALFVCQRWRLRLQGIKYNGSSKLIVVVVGKFK